MTDVKFLRRFNLMIFTILFLMGIAVFFAFYDRLDGYLKFAGMVTTVLIPLVVFGAAGSPVKKWIEGKNGKSPSDTQGPTE